VPNETDLTDAKRRKELEARNEVFEKLNSLDEESRQRILEAVAASYHFSPRTCQPTIPSITNDRPGRFPKTALNQLFSQQSSSLSKCFQSSSRRKLFPQCSQKYSISATRTAGWHIAACGWRLLGPT
jgi:hypothetical protein